MGRIVPVTKWEGLFASECRKCDSALFHIVISFKPVRKSPLIMCESQSWAVVNVLRCIGNVQQSQLSLTELQSSREN